MSENYQTIIGLEIHVELGTKSKMFCRCQNPTSADFVESRDNPNSFVCPICLGHPGTLPVANKEAIARTIKVGLALNSEIAEFTKFDRKHYFYPDLPKGYQISQYDMPLVKGGEIEITRKDGSVFKVRLIRIHLEEDAGKLVHPEGSQASLVDLNRAGVPLMEIVTEPDITSAEDARSFLQELRLLMRYLGVSDADMEKGQLRCDANVNIEVRSQKSLPKADQPLAEEVSSSDSQESIRTPITEIKNLNSFRMVERALSVEAERQFQEWTDGGAICQRKNKITVGWNDAIGKIVPQREKEEANDYRYFPEPDLPPIKIEVRSQKSEVSSNRDRSRFVLAEGNPGEIRISEEDLPELPASRRKRYLDLSLSSADADTLVTNREKGDYFDLVASKEENPETVKKIASIIINDLLDISIDPENLRKFAELLISGEISSKIGKELLSSMMQEDKSPEIIMEEKGWKQLNDQSEIESILDKVIVDNSAIVADYQSGKVAAIGFLIGAVMKASGGQANPKVVKEMLEIKLKVKN